MSNDTDPSLICRAILSAIHVLLLDNFFRLVDYGSRYVTRRLVTLMSRLVVEKSSILLYLLNRQIHNKYLVEGMDLVVKYSLYNVGDSAATNVKVTDKGFR
jgi:hypothetical protein